MLEFIKGTFNKNCECTNSEFYCCINKPSIGNTGQDISSGYVMFRKGPHGGTDIE